MADNQNEPEGLDDFLTSDDPQAAKAAAGMTQIINSPVVAAVGKQIDQNLQNYKGTVDSAIAGDQNAQNRLYQQNLGMAMGTIQSPQGPLLEASTAGYKEKLDEAKNLMNQIYTGMQQGTHTADQFAAASQRVKSLQGIADRHAAQLANPRPTRAYADGGDVQPEADPSAPPPGLDDFIAPEMQEATYGTPGQQAITGLEGAAEGATFGLSSGLETAMGVNPEDIRARAETNPIAHGAGQLAGLAGSSFIPGVGEANLIRGAGEAGAGALGLGKVGGSFLNQVAGDTVKGAFEAALFQGGEEVHKAFTQDPNQTAGSAIADIGLAGVMGGVFSGTLGAALRKTGATKELAPAFVSEVDRPAVDAGDFKASIENSNIVSDPDKAKILGGLGDERPDADEIRQAAQDIGAPVMEGQVSASKWVQKAEDSLVNGAPTYSGIKRAGLYKQGYDMAQSAVEQAIGSDAPQYSKAELGNILKTSIGSQIQEESAPITGMYNYIKQFHDIIPVADSAVEGAVKDIGNLKELGLSPSSPGSALAKNVMNEIGNLKTVDDIKSYRSMLFDRLSPTAPPGEKRVVAVIADKLKDLENNSIESFAKEIPAGDEAQSMVQGLVQQRKIADQAYKPFIKKVTTLAEQLGKGRVHGAQDAINFLNDLTPEQVTQKLFSKNNSEFLGFFQKNFPDQMELMRQYQKNALKEAATGPDGELSMKRLFNNVNKMEPEIQKSLFNPDELKKLQSAETYLRSFPPNFNPSGTAGMSAFRAFFEHPTGAAISTARDFGIERFIKGVSASPQVKAAVSLANSTVKGANLASRAVKSIFSPDNIQFPAAIAVSEATRDKLDKLVQDYAQDPSKLTSINDHNPVEAYNEPFANTSALAFNYLNGMRPSDSRSAPLDSPKKPGAPQKAAYNRALTIAQQPLTVLKHIQAGTLTSSDLQTLHAIYPNTYNDLAQKINAQMIDAIHGGKTIPYRTRQSLSLFMGQPLDSTMTPQAIISAQPMPQQPQSPGSQPGPGKSKHSTKSLDKYSQSYQTPGQAAEGRRQNKD